MKKDWIWLIALSLCIVFVIPWSVLRWQKEKVTPEDVQIRVLMPNKEVVKLPLEEYLVGVVSAEMPAEFELEALKAQAVASRTYAAKRIGQSSLPDVGYDVDTTVLSQAWLSDTQMRKNWGLLNYWRYRTKIQKAVLGTRGMVLMFNGEYIEALYHSSSGRKPTERSEEVWSSSRPYLQNVNSGEENLQRYIKKTVFTTLDLYKKLGLRESPRSLAVTDFQVLSKTSAGRAKTVRVLGRVYPATQIRTMLGLSSTDIEYAIQPECLTITAYGNGHAVGMSQWGANDLAKKSIKAEEILAYYYPGTKLNTLGNI
ncbi:stage II sporulation protein D [Desulfosporosinus sp.]|uniref:stage II sporulation protein D n=1 Tax=Desulfosporosinus sp. TaxID=157907 RepID=UPI00231D6EA9|nr:stage II sporulation protein D [Desulfosporosinus sp.]MCO5386141.1 stage II sporulation protein D [Desulfosporosinus sp.]MDA8220488.1 stage II sporulation protein D [Desulfitobacterium hafniense]